MTTRDGAHDSGTTPGRSSTVTPAGAPRAGRSSPGARRPARSARSTAGCSARYASRPARRPARWRPPAAARHPPGPRPLRPAAHRPARRAERRERQAVPVEEACIRVTDGERGMAEHAHEQVAVGAQTVDPGAGERAGQDRARLGPRRRPGDHLGQHRVVVHADDGAVLDSGVQPYAAGCHVEDGRRESGLSDRDVQAQQCSVTGSQPAAGSSAYRRASTAAPRPGGAAGGSRPPAATSSCSSTRSSPVVHSVTGCSTCSRVFISRNQKRPSGTARNSTVPAPVYPTLRATAIAAACSRSRKPGSARRAARATPR